MSLFGASHPDHSIGRAFALPRDRATPARGADPSGVRQCGVVGPQVAGDPEVEMANKDKGGKSTKKVATKDLKHKRLEKKAKKDAKGNKAV
jgi:hypothetical protein